MTENGDIAECLRNEEQEIGGIGNEVGGLSVSIVNKVFFWGIEDHRHTKLEEIPKYLYDALIKFEKER